MIDLRSDTLTQPTEGMRRAIAGAVVGDEQKREDPTVTALEERVAALLGHEEAVFVPTATMANQTRLRTLTDPGDEVVAEAEAHIFRYELGGPAVYSGLVMKPLATDDGRFTAAQLGEVVNPPADLHMAPTRLVCVENTHNGGGGRVWPLAQVREVTAEARVHGLATHLDGARLLNASVAAGLAPAEYGREFDTVSLCLSKGLGCPLGAFVAGSRERMSQARRFKHLFGGAMRQAGIVAAAGIYALDHHVERLADDHANARRLAEGLADAGDARRRPAGGDELRARRRRGARTRRGRSGRQDTRRRRPPLVRRPQGRPAGGHDSTPPPRTSSARSSGSRARSPE